MNTLIKNLAAQANFGSIDKSGEVVFDKRLEKFSELIVQECANICAEYSQSALKYSQFGSTAANDCYNLITEHFKD